MNSPRIPAAMHLPLGSIFTIFNQLEQVQYEWMFAKYKIHCNNFFSELECKFDISLLPLLSMKKNTTRELGESFNPKYNWGHHPIQVMMGLPGLSCRSTQFFSCHRFEAHFTEFQLTFSTLRATELVRIQSTAPKTSTFSFPNDVTEYKAIIIERIPIW